jgi:purine-binding chemotaxis protein CheW
VTEVLRISSDQIEPPPPVVVGIGGEFLVGVAKLEERLIILVDLEKILSLGEHADLQKLA